MDNKTLQASCNAYYATDADGYRKLLKPYLEKKFSTLGQEATNGERDCIIYRLDFDYFNGCCFCFDIGLPKEEKHHFLQKHFPSLHAGELYANALKVAKEINEENKYNLRVKGCTIPGGFLIKIYWE